MKTAAFLEYVFMFEPSKTWSNLYQFENALFKYFDSIGMDCEVLKTVEGAVSRRIVVITKKPEIVNTPEPVKKPIGRPKFLGNKIRALGEVDEKVKK